MIQGGDIVLEDIIQRKDVSSFIEEIEHNDRYFKKKSLNLFDHSFYVSKELALFIFYEALFKYKLLFENDYLLEEYLGQLRKIYKKFDCFDDIRESVHKVLCKLLCYQMGLKDSRQKESRDQIITYIYNHAVLNGYYIHGFQSSYADTILKEGFTPEKYENYYARFIKAREILEKYHITGVLTKNFKNPKIYYTGDMVMGCYYSLYAPMFFYKFILNCDYFKRRIRRDFYLKDSQFIVMSHLKRFLNTHMVKEKDQEFIINLVQDEWDLIHQKEKEISLLCVKRNKFQVPVKSLNYYLNDSRDLYELIDALLSSKNNHIDYQESLKPGEFEIMRLPYPYQEKEETPEKIEEEYEKQEQEVSLEFLNVYGNVSYLLLIGSLFVTIGVLISIIMVLRG